MNRSMYAFRQGCARRRQHFLNPHRFGGDRQSVERMIAIADQVSRRVVPRERFAELLSGPHRRRMGSDRDAHDASTIVRQDHQDEQQAARRRRDRNVP
jgi:hypothetical protein